MYLEDKVSASVNVVSEVGQDSVLGPLLFILCTSKLFYIAENHIVSYAEDSIVFAVILRLLSHPQVIELLNQDSAAINSWCLQ